MTFAGLVRDRAAIAIRATADILAFQADHLHRLSTGAFARIRFAALAAALSAASAENSRTFLYCQDMHLDQLRTALAFARLVGDKITFAVIFAVAYVINLALIGRNKHADSREQKQYADCSDDHSFHMSLLLPGKCKMK